MALGSAAVLVERRTELGRALWQSICVHFQRPAPLEFEVKWLLWRKAMIDEVLVCLPNHPIQSENSNILVEIDSPAAEGRGLRERWRQI
jgi:hypothetical protein